MAQRHLMLIAEGRRVRVEGVRNLFREEESSVELSPEQHSGWFAPGILSGEVSWRKPPEGLDEVPQQPVPNQPGPFLIVGYVRAVDPPGSHTLHLGDLGLASPVVTLGTGYQFIYSLSLSLKIGDGVAVEICVIGDGQVHAYFVRRIVRILPS